MHGKTTDRWLDRAFKILEANFEKYESWFQLIFAISIALFPTFLSLVATETGESGMSTIFSWGMAISFYVMVFTGWMLMRNSSKSGVNHKLDNIGEKLDIIINELRQDRNERNNKHE